MLAQQSASDRWRVLPCLVGSATVVLGRVVWAVLSCPVLQRSNATHADADAGGPRLARKPHALVGGHLVFSLVPYAKVAR